jgi:hypothetical protein
MPATDPILVVLQRLVAVVGGSADFWTAMRAGRSMTADPVSNFIHDDDARKTWLGAIANRTRRTPAAFPAVLLSPGRGREAPGPVQTFCQRVASQVMPFNFTVIGEGTEIVTIGQVATEIEVAVKAAGSQLGLPALVATSRFTGRVYDRASRDVSPDVERRQATVGLEITIKG